MRIVVICEGRTEAALRRSLGEFVRLRQVGANRTAIDPHPMDGSLLGPKLRILVRNFLDQSKTRGVIALTDVYPKFADSQAAKSAVASYVDQDVDPGRFRIHVAQFDLEAWLVPFWPDIAQSIGVKAKPPGANPEQINGQTPPSIHFNRLFLRAEKKYVKDREAKKWLTPERLEGAARVCPELKSFLNSLLEFAGAERLP